MGPARGRLAVSLDALTDALILIGQHGVLLRLKPQLHPSPRSISETVMSEINGAKELIQSGYGRNWERAREAGLRARGIAATPTW